MKKIHFEIRKEDGVKMLIINKDTQNCFVQLALSEREYHKLFDVLADDCLRPVTLKCRHDDVEEFCDSLKKFISEAPLQRKTELQPY